MQLQMFKNTKYVHLCKPTWQRTAKYRELPVRGSAGSRAGERKALLGTRERRRRGSAHTARHRQCLTDAVRHFKYTD